MVVGYGELEFCGDDTFLLFLERGQRVEHHDTKLRLTAMMLSSPKFLIYCAKEFPLALSSD